MSGDRELIELAAKGGGYRLCHFIDEGSAAYVSDDLVNERFGWRPLVDDGDALRLVVRLKFGMDTERGASSVFSDYATCIEDHAADPYAATRRAIVCAAAEVGKAMP
jgi:hypothetical protein